MEQILIDIEVSDVESKLGATTKRIEELKAANKALKKDLKNEDADWGAITAQMARNEAEIKSLTATQKTYQGQITAVNAATRQYGDSIKQQEAQLNDLRNQYASLTEAQRGSAEGQGLLAQIQEVEEATNKARASMGQYQQNVGHYQLAIENLKGGFKEVAGVIPGADKAMKVFNMTIKGSPLGWIAAAVGVLVAIFAKLKQAFKDNDDAGTALSVAMANFKPILTFINNLFQDLAIVVAKVAGAIGSLASTILSKLIPGYEKAAKAARDLVTAQDDLQEKERQRTREAAANGAKIAELDEKSRDSEEYTVKQRREFLKQKQKLQQAEYEAEVKLAKARLEIQIKAAKEQAKTDDATKDEIARLRAAIDEIERNHNQDLKNNLKVRKQLTNEEKANAKSAADAYKAMRKEIADAMREASELVADKDTLEYKVKVSDKSFDEAIAALKKNYKKLKAAEKAEVDALISELEQRQVAARVKIYEDANSEEIAAEHQKWVEIREASEGVYDLRAKQAQLAADKQKQIIAAQVKDEQDAAAAILQVDQQLADKQVELAELRLGNVRATRDSYASEQEYLNAELAAESALVAAVNTRAAVQQKAAQQNIKNTQRELKARQEMTAAIATAGGAILDLASTVAESSEENVRLQKAIALGQIAFSTAISIAQAIQGATQSAVATGAGAAFSLPAFVAEMVAIVMSNIAAAYKVISGSGYEQGGIVPGDSYTGDKVAANVNSGEMILTRAQQRRLWELANGGGAGTSYATMTAAFSAALERMPAPVMDYKEFVRFEKKVKYIDKIR